MAFKARQAVHRVVSVGAPFLFAFGWLAQPVPPSAGAPAVEQGPVAYFDLDHPGRPAHLAPTEDTAPAPVPPAAAAPAPVVASVAAVAAAPRTRPTVPHYAPRPVAARPPAPAQPSAAQRAWDMPHNNWFDSPSGDITVGLADYQDCTGQTPLPRNEAARDWCATSSDILYLVGHNPGQFSGLLNVHVNDQVRYWDSNGNPFTYQVAQIQRVSSSDAPAYLSDDSQGPHVVLQTCATPDGAYYWMYIGYPVLSNQ